MGEAIAQDPTIPDALAPLDRLAASVAGGTPTVRIGGTVTEVASTHCRVRGLSRFLKLGECVDLAGDAGSQLAEVVRVDAGGASIKAFDARLEVGLGAIVWQRGSVTLSPHASWKGRVLNALGEPIDDAGPLLQGPHPISAHRVPPAPMRRQRIKAALKTGVRVLDLFTPLCAGQRIGIFAGSGVGKSTLLSMLARSQGFDTAVIGLVGERGREVREFLDIAVNRTQMRVVTVVATGDEGPMMRRLAPRTAMCIAEHFRDQGEKVLLIIDSVTRYAHAIREVALAAGEPPVARGYTPSVFSELPELLERAGLGEEGSGSITGIFSVLVDGDDHNDPIADCIRGTLDGHVVLDRAIAEQGRYPSVNLLTSVSRLAETAWSPEQKRLVRKLRSLVSHFEDTRDLRLMGGYRAGTDPELDKAIVLVPKLYEALRQGLDDAPSSDVFQDIARSLAGETSGPGPA